MKKSIITVLLVLSLLIVSGISGCTEEANLSDNLSQPIPQDQFSKEATLSDNLSQPIPRDQFSNVSVIHFQHMPITYGINTILNESQSDEASKRVRNAFKIIEHSTDDILKFQEIEDFFSADIQVYLVKNLEDVQEINKPSDGSEEALGLGGLDLVKEDTKILKSSVYLLPYDAKKRCVNFPDVEIHEILHALGFGHTFGGEMDPLKYCVCGFTELSKNTIACLKNTYSNGETRTIEHFGSAGDVEFNCRASNIYPYIREFTGTVTMISDPNCQ